MEKVAILGFGTVGSGVAEVLTKNGAHIGEKLHGGVELKYILDVRDFPDSPFAPRMIHDFSRIEQDREVTIVVETIGGATVAREFTQRALRAGKSVVTSNKELVAKHGYELMTLAREHGAGYFYEASVGGGIPIIRPLRQCLAANHISEICGILNGTTNYILTRMIRAGLPFDAALREAQEKGYAEADPTADIEGIDACRKISILSSLAFGRQVDPGRIHAEGISGVTAADVEYARCAGRKIKLLGRAMRRADGRVYAYVAPHLVDGADPLAGVEDVFNAITVKGDAIGDVMFYGRGAGKLPTASAVVADVMEAARTMGSPKYADWGPGGEDVLCSGEDVSSRWYVRALGTGGALLAGFPGCRVLERADAPEEETALLTQAMTREELARRLGAEKAASVFRLLD